MTNSLIESGLADRTARVCFQAGHAGSIPVARSTEKRSKITAATAG